MTRLTQGRVIGEGGMAIVYEGTRLTGFDHAPVAIKRLLDERKAEPEIVARFVQEGWLGLELAHKNLGKVYELDRDHSGDLRIVMEMVDGVALEDIDMVLRPHPRLIRTILFALFDVVGYLHDCKVLHRDISPRNILISRAGMVKLIDLGLARDLDAPASEPGPFKGTAHLPAPTRSAAKNSPRARMSTRLELSDIGCSLGNRLTVLAITSRSPSASTLRRSLHCPMTSRTICDR